VSKRNLNTINGKNKRVSGTPINYDSKKRISQPMGFSKNKTPIDNIETNSLKARKSTVIIG